MSSRLGTAFHETFRLDRSRLAEVLRVAVAKHPAPVRRDDLRTPATSLGANMIPAFVNYGIGCGLIEKTAPGYRLTPFGLASGTHDPNLSLLNTQWLMHYHLSATAGPGPLFWHHLFAREIQVGVPVHRDRLVDGIALAHRAATGKELNSKTASSTAGVFLNTYLSPDGLGRLGLLEEVGNDPKLPAARLVGGRTPPDPSVVGLALINWWCRTLPSQVTAGIERLFESDGVASILFLDRASTDDVLDALHSQGVLDVFRVAPPFQIVRHWQDDVEASVMLLQRMYEIDAR
jgi:hypothetical protein